MIRYKDVLKVLTGFFGGCLLWSEYEKNHFVTDHTTISSAKLGEEKQLVFLSDLHSKEFGEGNSRLIRAIDRIHPDAVLVGGDMMIAKKGGNHFCDLTQTMTLIRNLASRYPVYYAHGNHEERLRREPENYGLQYENLRRSLEKCGVVFLDDCSALFGEDIVISGANLDETYYKHKLTMPKLPADVLAKQLGAADSTKFQILMFHSPLFFARCREWGADLTLCGHFHGGTIRLPFIGGLMTPQFQFFVKECGGRFDADGRTMIVSRGLGTHSVNIRFRNRPELVWITLAPEEN